MSRKATNTAERALLAFRKECDEEGLGLECALAQMALFCLRLREAHKADSWQRTCSAMYSIRREAENVMHALQAEYPEMNWAPRPAESRSGDEA